MSNSQEINYSKQPKMFMFKLFVDIYKLIPKDNKTLQCAIKYCLTNLSIKAPEIVGESWKELFNTLQNNVVLGKFEENPQWKQNIFNLYHKQYNLAVSQMADDDDSDDENDENDENKTTTVYNDIVTNGMISKTLTQIQEEELVVTIQ